MDLKQVTKQKLLAYLNATIKIERVTQNVETLCYIYLIVVSAK